MSENQWYQYLCLFELYVFIWTLENNLVQLDACANKSYWIYSNYLETGKE